MTLEAECILKTAEEISGVAILSDIDFLIAMKGIVKEFVAPLTEKKPARPELNMDDEFLNYH